jgi:hypothetical protein
MSSSSSSIPAGPDKTAVASPSAGFWTRKQQAALDFVEEQERAEKHELACQRKEWERISALPAAANDPRARKRAPPLSRDTPKPEPGVVSDAFVAGIRKEMPAGREILAMRVMEDNDLPLHELLDCLIEYDLIGIGGTHVTSAVATDFEEAYARSDIADRALPLVVMPPADECELCVRPELLHSATDYMSDATRARCRALMGSDYLEAELPRMMHLTSLDPAVLDALRCSPDDTPLANRGALLSAIRKWRAVTPNLEGAREDARSVANLDEASVALLEAHVLACTRAPRPEFFALEINLFALPANRVETSLTTQGVAMAVHAGRADRQDHDVVAAVRVALPMTRANGANAKTPQAKQVMFVLKRLLGVSGEDGLLPLTVRPKTTAPAPALPSPTAIIHDPALAELQDPHLVLEYWADIGDDGIVMLFARWQTRAALESLGTMFRDFASPLRYLSVPPSRQAVVVKQ